MCCKRRKKDENGYSVMKLKGDDTWNSLMFCSFPKKMQRPTSCVLLLGELQRKSTLGIIFMSHPSIFSRYFPFNIIGSLHWPCIADIKMQSWIQQQQMSGLETDLCSSRVHGQQGVWPSRQKILRNLREILISIVRSVGTWLLDVTLQFQGLIWKQ